MRPAAIAPSRDLPILERLSFAMQRAQKLADTDGIVREIERKVAAIFKLQGKLFLVELAKMRGSFQEAPGESSWGPSWDRVAQETADGFAVVLESGVSKALKKGGQRLSDDLELGISWDLKNPRAVAWLEQHSAGLVSGIDDTSKGYIRTVMAQAVDEGWGYDKTAKILTERFSQFAVGMPQKHIDSRAHLIATTESASGYEAGNALLIQDMAAGGIPMQKHWLTVGDDRVDEEQCGPNEDEGWIPSEAEFQSGDSEPPAHPACRCTTQYEVVPLEQEVGAA